MADAAQPPDLEPGDFYEDCRYHPMVCVGLGGVVELTAAQAIQRRLHWDEFVEERGLADYSSSHYPRGNPPRSVG
jgi:hypothetical protein